MKTTGWKTTLAGLLVLFAIGCTTTVTTDLTGNTTKTRGVDTQAVATIWQLARDTRPEAVAFITEINAALEKPEGPSRTAELTALLNEATEFIEAARARGAQ